MGRGVDRGGITRDIRSNIGTILSECEFFFGSYVARQGEAEKEHDTEYDEFEYHGGFESADECLGIGFFQLGFQYVTDLFANRLLLWCHLTTLSRFQFLTTGWGR